MRRLKKATAGTPRTLDEFCAHVGCTIELSTDAELKVRLILKACQQEDKTEQVISEVNNAIARQVRKRFENATMRRPRQRRAQIKRWKQALSEMRSYYFDEADQPFKPSGPHARYQASYLDGYPWPLSDLVALEVSPDAALHVLSRLPKLLEMEEKNLGRKGCQEDYIISDLLVLIGFICRKILKTDVSQNRSSVFFKLIALALYACYPDHYLRENDVVLTAQDRLSKIVSLLNNELPKTIPFLDAMHKIPNEQNSAHLRLD